jgi:hypothetical protein
MNFQLYGKVFDFAKANQIPITGAIRMILNQYFQSKGIS